MITVFTPTYNREKLLPRLYNSLLAQSTKHFEWLIIDDGSTDNTESLIKEYILNKDNGFDIVYQKQENGGKHRAINRGVNLARGELFFIVDSDDWLSDDAIELIEKRINTLNSESAKFAGIAGLRVYPDGKCIGTTFKGEYVDALTFERMKYGISGDKAEVLYTSVLKKYPFPEIEGEKFCPEALVWNRISEDDYYLRYTNEKIYYCEYQNDGLTSKIDELLCENFKSYSVYATELLNSKYVSWIEKKKTLINYIRRSIINNKPTDETLRELKISRLELYICLAIGKIVYAQRTK